MSEYIVNFDGELGAALAVACAGAGFAREEIVRCKDCKHYEEERKPTTSINGLCLLKHPNWCYRHKTSGVEPDGFCSCGERKEAVDD